MNDTNGEYRIIGYIDDLEEAQRRIKANNLSEDIFDKINTIHDDLVDLQDLLVTSDDNNKLKEYLEDSLVELARASGEGKVNRIQELIVHISGKVEQLKEELE